MARRLRASIRHNLTYYLSIGAAGLAGVLALLASGQLSWADLLPLAMLLSNTYGARPVPAGFRARVLSRTRRPGEHAHVFGNLMQAAIGLRAEYGV